MATPSLPPPSDPNTLSPEKRAEIRQKIEDDKLSDPSYIRSQAYKKRVFSRFESSSPENAAKEMNTRDNVVLMPDGSAQVTGPTVDHRREVGVLEAAKTIRPEDLLELHQQPCVREGLMPGIVGGVVMGGLRLMFGSPIGKATNWAVGSWALISFAGFEYCQSKRRQEKAGVKAAVEIMRDKANERREAQRAERQRLMKEQDEERRRKEEEGKRWWGLGKYKPW